MKDLEALARVISLLATSLSWAKPKPISTKSVLLCRKNEKTLKNNEKHDQKNMCNSSLRAIPSGAVSLGSVCSCKERESGIKAV
jgi:hypothetical protein